MPLFPSDAVTIGRSRDSPSTTSWTGAVMTSDMWFLPAATLAQGVRWASGGVGSCGLIGQLRGPSLASIDGTCG
ncbi:hypothetical protein CBZ_07720 [Cellulomonas biazotea]|uniref:Uncharacterized protein n=1 Tax=Cellulomonas biazotea TaxID=1709 RepID=A0A402DNP5_9CELL|nr:hypothetical protein CBZ_07720 [Cellulomonas biazotea]